MTTINQSTRQLPRFNLEVASTPNCNMACTYCFEGEELKSKSKQTLENIDYIVNRIYELLESKEFSDKYSGITLNFWGGEPTINFEWNKELINRIREIGYVDNNIVDFFIYSNGFDYLKVKKHIDLFTFKELEENKLRLQISYDGIGLTPSERIDHKGNSTNERVRNNILTIALVYPELNLRTKATIQPIDLLNIKTIWLDYCDLFHTIYRNSKRSKTEIFYSPTINYIDDFETTEEYLKDLQKAFEEIASYELSFYNKYKRHLFAWFGSGSSGGLNPTIQNLNDKRKTNCSAGVNILLLDVEGNASVCHGTLYSPLKEDFKKFTDTNIKDVRFIDKFFKSRNELEKSINRIDPSCESCEATVCYKCPIINVEQSKTQLANENQENLGNLNYISENFQTRDSRHCGIYKTFGPIDKALFALKKDQTQDQKEGKPTNG